MPIVYEWLDAAPTAAPAPAAASAPSAATKTVNVQDSLDANETVVSVPTVSTPAFTPSSLPTLNGQDSEMIGTFIVILLCLYVIKVIIEFIPKILLIGIGACVVYAFFGKSA